MTRTREKDNEEKESWDRVCKANSKTKIANGDFLSGTPAATRTPASASGGQRSIH